MKTSLLLIKKTSVSKNMHIDYLELKKVIKRKGDKLYVKWKVYGNSFNIWINKKTNSINE